MVRARAEGPFRVDLASFPLVRIHSPSASDYEHVDVQSFFPGADAAMARRLPFAVLHDARDMPYVDEPRQARFLDELHRRRLLIGKYMRAYAAVVSSPRERGLITALGWSAHLPLPTRLFSTEAEASAFLLARCSANPRAKTRARGNHATGQVSAAVHSSLARERGARFDVGVAINDHGDDQARAQTVRAREGTARFDEP